MRHVVAALVLLTLTGCGGRAVDVIQAQAVTLPGATSVPLIVATTRRAAPRTPGLVFGGERGAGLSYAAIDVSVPPAHRPGEVEWPDRLPADPATDFVTTRVASLDRDEALTELRGRIARTGRHHVLLFVHGYNNRFEDAVYRFAQIAHDAGAPVIPVLFTWPSRGSLLAYGYDHESASFSRDALESVLRSLAREPGVREITVLAHSMGNWVALEALRQAAIRDGEVPRKIGDVMLAAPDVDVDVVGTQLRAMGPRLPRFTLFVSRDDRALSVSRSVWGGSARLGAVDPDKEPYRSTLAGYGVTVLDLTALRAGDGLNHGKFAESPQVVRFIGQRLAQGQEIEGRPAGLGEAVGAAVTGVASRVGTAAGVAATLPLAVVDPASRRSFGERLGAVAPEVTGEGVPAPVGKLESLPAIDGTALPKRPPG